MNSTKKSLSLLKYLPRFKDNTLVADPFKPKKYISPLGPRRIRWPTKSNEARQRWHPIGYEQGNIPWFLRVPAERYYEKFDTRRQYPPFSLLQLQMLIDTKLVDPNKPIDLASICNSNHYDISTTDNHYGVHLTSDGMDNFCTCVNIEVQYAREPVIASIERYGGRITTAFYDIKSIFALSNPYKFFQSGEPIPKRLLPPPNAIDYYTDPKNRGYLADPVEVEKERFKLAQKYGYELTDVDSEAKREMLNIRKHERQVFFGLQPGYVVNLKDREILEPLDNDLRDYYGLPKLSEGDLAYQA